MTVKQALYLSKCLDLSHKPDLSKSLKFNTIKVLYNLDNNYFRKAEKLIVAICHIYS